jgi:hypothetical protein
MRLPAKEDVLDKTARMLGKNIRSIHKKLSRLMQSRGISRIEFPNGKARIDPCKVTETHPRADLENETILSIVKSGYIDIDLLDDHDGCLFTAAIHRKPIEELKLIGGISETPVKTPELVLMALKANPPNIGRCGRGCGQIAQCG